MKKAQAPRKPKRQPLTPDRIVLAAIELTDSEGFAALSMRKLAARLQVEAMSLYDHFPSKEALLLAMRSHFYRQLDFDFPANMPWHEQMAGNMTALYGLGLRHPSFVAVHLYVLSVPESRQRGELDLALLKSVGFPEDEAAAAIMTLVSFVIGFLHRMVLSTQPTTSRIAQIVQRDQDAAFRFGLNAILTGLRAGLHSKD